MNFYKQFDKFLTDRPITSWIIAFIIIIISVEYCNRKWDREHQEKLERECPKYEIQECVDHCMTYGVLDTEVNTKCIKEKEPNENR